MYRQTSVYAAGAGLGASKGKDITKYTEGYTGYVHMAQDAVSTRLYNVPVFLFSELTNDGIQALERYGS